MSGGKSFEPIRPSNNRPQAAQCFNGLDLETCPRDRWIHHDACPQVQRIEILNVTEHVDAYRVIGHGSSDTPCHSQSGIGNGALDLGPGKFQKIAQPITFLGLSDPTQKTTGSAGQSLCSSTSKSTPAVRTSR